jgi:plastocyanin
LLILPLLLVAGCGGPPESPPAPAAGSPSAPARAPEAPPASGAVAGATGTSGVQGAATFEGEVPSLRPIPMEADPNCVKKHEAPVMPDALVLGEGNRLANVFVRVRDGLAAGTYPAPPEPLVLDQHGCRYAPHVAGAMVGQKLRVLNSDGLLHNVHSLSKLNPPFNRAMPANVTEFEYTFTKQEEMFKVKCDVHPWMGAYIAVVPHPFFAVTGTDGRFEIADLPAGRYEVEAWHERLGTQTASVELAEGQVGSLDFVFRK